MNCQILYDPVHGAFRIAKLGKSIGHHGRLNLSATPGTFS